MIHPFDIWWADFTTFNKSQEEIARWAWNESANQYNLRMQDGVNKLFPKTELEKKVETEQPLQYELHLT